jgi:hypothetical protein
MACDGEIKSYTIYMLANKAYVPRSRLSNKYIGNTRRVKTFDYLPQASYMSIY